MGDTELKLATQLIDQIAAAAYDPHAFVDEEKQRILAAVEKKIAGEQVVSHAVADQPKPSAQVVDLVAALRASLAKAPSAARPKRSSSGDLTVLPSLKDRKPARRASTSEAKPAKTRKG